MHRYYLHKIAKIIFPWIIFHLFLRWGYQVKDFFRQIPTYGDVLESIWGMIWYERTLLQGQGNPFFTPYLAHPLGWHTANLAHTPFLILVGLLFHRIGGPAFAYNFLAILSLYVCFAGAFLAFRRFTGWTAATLAALAYTFVGFRWYRITEGHLNIAWLTSLLPWMIWSLEKGLRQKERRKKPWLLAGVFWGLMINFSLYGILLGGLILVGWLLILRWRWTIALAGIALTMSAPIIVLQAIAASSDGITYFEIWHIHHWGASLNELAIPNVFHPIEPLRRISRTVYGGFLDESGIWNMGFVPIGLALFGMIRSRGSRNSRIPRRFLALMVMSGILALGPYLKWDGKALDIHLPFLRTLHIALWKIGHQRKPELFPIPEPPSYFVEQVPMPAMWFLIFLPFSEGWRVISRCLMVSAIGLFGLAARAWEVLPRKLQILAMILWLIETLPAPIRYEPFPFALHPAYEWLSKQNLQSGEGIIDLPLPAPDLSTDLGILWSTLFHHKPTASISRPFLPKQIRYLTLTLATYDWGDERVALIFRAFRVRYIFMHIIGEQERALWARLLKNPAIQSVGCFDPSPPPSLWTYPICIAAIQAEGGRIALPLVSGWSGLESWGIWAEGTESRSFWIAPRKMGFRLLIEAFPYCVPGQQQRIKILINGNTILTYEWNACDRREFVLEIPATLIQRGLNEILFRYGYAVRPVEITGGQNPDARLLSVGFTRLEIQPLTPAK